MFHTFIIGAFVCIAKNMCLAVTLLLTDRHICKPIRNRQGERKREDQGKDKREGRGRRGGGEGGEGGGRGRGERERGEGGRRGTSIAFASFARQEALNKNSQSLGRSFATLLFID